MAFEDMVNIRTERPVLLRHTNVILRLNSRAAVYAGSPRQSASVVLANKRKARTYNGNELEATFHKQTENNPRESNFRKLKSKNKLLYL